MERQKAWKEKDMSEKELVDVIEEEVETTEEPETPERPEGAPEKPEDAPEDAPAETAETLDA